MVKQTFFLSAAALLTGPIMYSSNEGTIPILIPSIPPGTSIPRPHAPSHPIAEGYFDIETNLLTLHFVNLGTCHIQIQNTAGETISEDFDTSLEFFSVYLSGQPGLYSITVNTENGSMYISQFLLI